MPVVTGLVATRGSCAKGARRRNTSARAIAGVRWSASGNASDTGNGPAPVERNPACGDVSKRVGAVVAETMRIRCAADANQLDFAKINRTDDPMMLPGALKYGGLDCLASLAAPNPLYIHNSQESNLGTWLRAAYAAGGHPENLELKPESQSPDGVIAWLIR